MIYLQLFFEFFKTGLFALGGGLATIPFLQEMAASYGWFTNEQLTDMIALSECTPGPIGVNMATFAGYTAAGVLGGVVASIAVVLPSLIIILIIARQYAKFRNNKLVDSIFAGVRPGVAALISVVCLNIIKVSVVSPIPILIFAVMFFSIVRFKYSPLWLLLGGGILGILLKL